MSSDKPLVLIVDDNPTNIDLLVNTLKEEYRLGVAKDGLKALEYTDKYLPDLILLDVMMPEMSGYDVCVKLKAVPRTANIPVVFITALDNIEDKTHGFQAGGVDYITKPFHVAEVKARVKTHLSLKRMREELNDQNIILEQKVAEKTNELHQMLQATIHTMALTVEIRDPYTAGHQHRVALLACAIAKKMNLSSKQIRTIDIAGNLHDIGKIRIPTSIINRPGELLDIEYKMLKIHARVGYDILKNIPSPLPFAKAVLQHHERLDGSGYPQGITSDEILPEAKVVTVADVTEALSSFRPYRPAMGIDVALEEILKYKGVWYDPDAVDACRELFIKENFNYTKPSN
ncbi:MAG: response regulator [Deltaproteobacteria bacterium]|nr:response regulator [Deltaproteobacteria bacterium]